MIQGETWIVITYQIAVQDFLYLGLSWAGVEAFSKMAVYQNHLEISSAFDQTQDALSHNFWHQNSETLG
jgi:hypothetical protein